MTAACTTDYDSKKSDNAHKYWVQVIGLHNITKLNKIKWNEMKFPCHRKVATTER